MKNPILFLLVLVFLSCNSQSNSFFDDCMKPDFSPFVISDIYLEIEPAIRNFGFELKKTSDGGYIFFVPFWGDAYKFSPDRKIEFKLSFNSKSLSENKERINYISGTTPAFDVFGDNIYFLQSNRTIKIYNLQGKEVTNYSLNITDISIDDMEVIGEDIVILSGTQVVEDKVVLSFFKMNLVENTLETIEKIDLKTRKNPFFIKFNENEAQVLIERDSSITELDFEKRSIHNISFNQAKNRDYNKYDIPIDVDYISLPEEEQRKYRNDKTIKFGFNESELIILHEVANKSKSGKPYEKLLTKHSLPNGKVHEKLGLEGIIDFDKCGNILQIEEINGEYYISIKSFESVK
ncbi:hypothetical protein [Algoriphagus sp. CAU 1675]|uniref:hypothetical protein n=1 Tax=Algoriphagus sp. CAU 1675 TaxID=3032597 RepID=UPI0023DAD140|nr:hypothetical protein [Algoriphagus sp. CAU 1675]MDF2157299.1 hypothetical protein [Algoriphagus sp. CAU 1675]